MSPAEKRWTDRRELVTSASPEAVYQAWADPSHIAAWFPDRAHGEAKPGKSLVHVFEDFGFEAKLDVIEAEPGKRLVLESMSPRGVPFRQEISIRREGGETVVELVHSGFGADADFDREYKGVDSGWKLALAVLKHYLEHHFDKPRQGYFAMQPAAFEYDALAPLFRSEAGLARWLTRSGSVGDVGSPVELALRDGRSLTGRVLADSGLEVALAWDEIDGVLELKAFDAGEQRMLALRASSWAASPPTREAMLAWMRTSLTLLQGALRTPRDRLEQARELRHAERSTYERWDRTFSHQLTRMQHGCVAVDARDDHHEIRSADHGLETLQAATRGGTVVMLHSVAMNLRDRLEGRSETVGTSHDGDGDRLGRRMNRRAHRKASLR